MTRVMSSRLPVIAHVLHRLDRAGAEVLAAGLAGALRDRYRFVFLCLDGLGPLAEALAADGFVVEALGRQPGIDRRLAKRLRSRLEAHDAQLVHAHQYTPFFYSAMSRGIFNPSAPRRPILFTEHGRHYPDTPSLKRTLANKLLLRKPDRVTAVGRFVKQALIQNEAIPPDRITVIYNGIDPGPEPTDQDRVLARERLGIDAHRPLVMHVARFHPVKDHATAIRAFARLHADRPDALLVLVGGGEGRSAIEAQAAELNLADAVRFTGPVDNARELIPAADLCILTSLSEGVSVTLLEAMAAAKPVLATDVGGNPEVVTHNRTGALAPRGDDARLAQAMHELLAHPAYTQRQLGSAGRAKLLEQFTAERMHNDYASCYQAMLRRD